VTSPFAAAAFTGGCGGDDARFGSGDIASTASGSRFTTPFASGASPFAAASSSDEGDVRIVTDTNPVSSPAAVELPVGSALQQGSDAGNSRASRADKSGGRPGSSGGGAAATSSKPALSPFALLQCAQDDSVDKC
jgi:hypothetical protein